MLPKHAWGGGPPAQPGVEGQRGCRDRFGYSVRVSHDVTGGDAEDGQAMGSKGDIALGIALGSMAAIMRFAVDLDRKFGSGAVKVEDIGKNWMLPTEFQTVGFQSQALPKQHFGQAHCLPQSSRLPDRRGPSTTLRVVPLPMHSMGRI